MDSIKFSDITLADTMKFIGQEADAVIAVDSNDDKYRCVSRKGLFTEIIDETGIYTSLIKNLWYHFNNSNTPIVEDYDVFLPTAGKFLGKYSKRINVQHLDVTHIVQMTIYPTPQEGIYIFVLDELDGSQYVDEALTHKKVDTIQNTYLFSMYVDLVKDTTNSISITEISDEVMNQQLKYSEWRLMIVNMIWPDDQAIFLERTDPEYLRKNLAPGRASSYDCLMMNLEGKYIWVKLIFSRAETSNASDFRFVFMVQDINDTAEELMSTLKKYEELASKDPLTSAFNHGRIETEISNAIDGKNTNGAKASMFMMDIDYFKRVNDNYGHSVGDATLVHFVRTVSGFLKERNAVIGRWGGEEFVAVIYDTDEDECIALAEALREAVAAESFETIGSLTCSIGVTHIRPDDTASDAFNRMDKAVYEAKSAGRNCVKIM